jgi:hypothetical protein
MKTRETLTYIVFALCFSLLAEAATAQTYNQTPTKSPTATEAEPATISVDDVEEKKESSVSNINELQFSSTLYSNQASYWENETRVNPNDPNAWYNYYKSNRYSYYSKTSKKVTAAEQNDLDNITSSMGAVVPESYEYNYIKYWNGNYNTSNFKYLEAAYALDPTRAELYDDFIAHYEITGMTSKKNEFCQKLMQSGEISEEIMAYNYNVLMSLDQNAVLVTNGENDTYPLWVLQEVKGIRTDVTVLNTDLLGVDAYRKAKLEAVGLSSSHDPKTSKTSFLKSIAKSNTSAPVYFGLTVEPSALKAMKGELFVTGLAMKYSPNGMNNLQVLQTNWETTFKADYLEKTGSTSTIRKMNMNYVLPLLMLGSLYQKQGNVMKEKEVQELAYQLAKANGKEKMVTDYLKK